MRHMSNNATYQNHGSCCPHCRGYCWTKRCPRGDCFGQSASDLGPGVGENCWKSIYHGLHNARDVVCGEGMGCGSRSFKLCKWRDATSSGHSLRCGHTRLWVYRQCGRWLPLLLPIRSRWHGCLLASRPSFLHNKWKVGGS